jgi:23S rRNA pseudouridine1911/1915/1917 synthase
VAWGKARELCATGRVRVVHEGKGEVVVDAARRMQPGETVEIDEKAPRLRRGVLPEEAIAFVDRDVVVVRKPAGVMTVPFEAGDRDTLVDQTRAALRRREGEYDPMLGTVQRLDKDTTGLIVFARTLGAKKHLEAQLRRHAVLRRYLAIAHGDVRDARHESLIVQDRGDGLRGSWGVWRAARGEPPVEGQPSVTHVKRVEGLRGATLIECRLETGRQHQIRIHLSEAGHPLVGEKVYVREFERRARIDAPRPMLHAAELGFVHPRTGALVHFEEPLPRDFEDVLAKLRAGPGRRA